MFVLEDPGRGLCDRRTRREVLRAGGLGMLGLGAATGLLPRARGAAPPSHEPRAKACIVLFLLGGPPQHSTWDPKPDAVEEIRGAFGPVATAVPGTHFCELMPNAARLAGRMAVLRAVSTGDHAHSSSGYAMLTGQAHQPTNQENANPGPPNDWPTLGAVVQHLKGGDRVLPTAIRLPHHIFNTDQSVWPGQSAGFLGAAADPWLFRCTPADPTLGAPDFGLADDVPLARFHARRSLLTQLDAHLRSLDRGGHFDAIDARHRQALELLGRAEAFTACDLSRESDGVRRRYGAGQFGQSVLLARRLVEAGVSFVQVNWFRGPDEPSDAPCWDSHANETSRLKDVLVPPFDQAYGALVDDLADRGLLESTLIVAMGEFGRTPKFNARGGRDHWGHVFSLALAGGGVRGGVVHGASDHHGGYPVEGLVRPEDLSATIFHLLGLSGSTEIRDSLGRPFPISRGRVIQEVLA